MDLETTRQELDAWIEKSGFLGWDPFDALNSPLLARLTGKNRKVGQLWVQLLKRSPVNVRPLLGIPKGYNPKGMGLFLATYLRKYRENGSAADLDRARTFSRWLAANRCEGWSGACWGYNFAWPNRAFFVPAGTPTAVNTAFIGLALLDDYRVAGSADSLALARSACDFLISDLNRLPGEDETCLSYTPLDRRFVHNANILAGWLLAEVSTVTGESRLQDLAAACARFTVARQADDGSWPYGVAACDRWIDNFHTGYVLVGLNRIAGLLGRQDFQVAAENGYHYWRRNFFTPEGIPKFYPDRVFPIDVHAISQAILTFLEFEKQDPQARREAMAVANWSADNFRHPDGYFYYQRHRLYTIRIPYLRWSQAWMQRALAELPLP